MEIHEIASAINDWPIERLRRFYVHLAHNLTIAGRAVWSNERLSPAEMVVRLKALNELMHRVIGQAMGDGAWPASQFIGEYLLAFDEDHPELDRDMVFAVRSAYEYAVTRPSE